MGVGGLRSPFQFTSGPPRKQEFLHIILDRLEENDTDIILPMTGKVDELLVFIMFVICAHIKRSHSSLHHFAKFNQQ